MNRSGHAPGPEDVTTLLRRSAAGDSLSTERLVESLYNQLRRIAQRQMADERPGHSLQATALVHEAYVRLVRRDEVQWSSRAQFYVAAAHAMQRVLIDHARKKRRLKRGGDRQRLTGDVVDLAVDEHIEDAIALQDALDRLEAEDARAARVMRLRFYAGLTVDETAKAMAISERTVMREWTYARAWLRDALQPKRS